MRRLLLPLLLIALLVPAGAAEARKVPRGWLGVSFGPEYVAKRSGLTAELKRMRRAGAESARFALYWSRAQPYATMAEVPPDRAGEFTDVGGVPTDFRFLDQLVMAAARARIPLLPVVLGAPMWATSDASRPIWVPREAGPYASFLAALVHRYGPHGELWAGHPALHSVPVRRWQIWNEVSNPYYWDYTYASTYPRVLRAAYDAVKAADPGAVVVESGLNSGGASTSWSALEGIYRQLDAQGLGRPFDEIAVHVYTKDVPDALKVVQNTRAVARRHGDGARPIRVTELSWPAARGKLRDEHGHKREFFAATSDKGMAKRLVKGVRLLARHRKPLGIAGVDWFQWASSYKGTGDAFRYSGLRQRRSKRMVDKPAMKAFRSVARQLRR